MAKFWKDVTALRRAIEPGGGPGSGRVLAVLEGILSVEQAGAFEEGMLPEKTDEEVKDTLAIVRKHLADLKRDDVVGELVAAIDAEIAKRPVEGRSTNVKP